MRRAVVEILEAKRWVDMSLCCVAPLTDKVVLVGVAELVRFFVSFHVRAVSKVDSPPPAAQGLSS